MKKTNFNLILLNAVFILGLLTSNLFGGKIIHILGFTVAGAIITYPLTFLTTDIIGEIWGKREANECVKIGVIIQLGFLILGYLSLKIKPDDLSLELQNSLTMVLNQGLRMTAASMGAFICSQTLDITIFHSLKDKYRGKHKWLRNNAGTMISQFYYYSFLRSRSEFIIYDYRTIYNKTFTGGMRHAVFLFFHKKSEVLNKKF